MRSTRKSSANSLGFSLVLHLVGILLMMAFWQQHTDEMIEDAVNAELIGIPITNRVTLRRSRTQAIRPEGTIGPTEPVKATQPLTRMDSRTVTYAQLPTLHNQQEQTLRPMSFRERLAAPDTGVKVQQVVRQTGDAETPGLLSERREEDRTLSMGSGERPMRDAVGDAMMAIADALTQGNASGKLDVVFLLDASGSMDPHIAAVARHLSEMAEEIAKRDVDVLFGVVGFRRIGRQDVVETWELSGALDDLRQAMRSLRCEGDERALDVIMKTLDDYALRERALKAFILVTDERLTGKASLSQVITACQKAPVRVNVLGLLDREHKQLAKDASGLWFPLPKDYE